MFEDYALTDIGCRIDFSYQSDTFRAMNAIGARIGQLRSARDLGQVALGERIGVNQSTVSNIENGAGFGADVLMSLCDVLGATPEYIMEGAHRDDVGESEVIAIYRKLDAPNRIALLAMARGLAGSTPRPTLTASGYGSTLDGLEPLERISKAKPRTRKTRRK